MDLSPGGSGGGHSFTVGGAGNYNRTQPVSRGSLLLGTPSHSGETSFWGANATAAHSNYFWFGVLSKTTLGFAASGQSTSPYENIPEGSVRVSSVLPDGSASVKSLLFGGSSTASSLTNQAIQLTNQLTWFSADNKHSLKVMSTRHARRFPRRRHAESARDLQLQLARRSRCEPPGELHAHAQRGDASGQPALRRRLARRLVASDARSAGAVRRACGRQTLSLPADAQLRTSATRSARTTRACRIACTSSPRVGMQWYYGHSEEVEYAPGAARPPRAVIHAGVGVFQNMATAQLISTAVSATGLPTRRSRSPASATRCRRRTGTRFSRTPTRFPIAAPTVRRAASSRRRRRTSPSSSATSANRARCAARPTGPGPVFDNRFVLGLADDHLVRARSAGGVRHQPRSTARFTLADEANRPIFVDPSAIVPATGAVAIAGSRVTPAYQHVWEARSGLKVPSKQFTINFKPVTANPRLKWEATYTLLDAHETFTGFTSTAGNPFDVESGRSLQVGRHTLLLAGMISRFIDLIYITAYERFLRARASRR